MKFKVASEWVEDEDCDYNSVEEALLQGDNFNPADFLLNPLEAKEVQLAVDTTRRYVLALHEALQKEIGY